jgi:hypothetical protein
MPLMQFLAALSPKALYGNAIEQAVSDPAKRRDAMACVERYLATVCRVTIESHKGEMDERRIGQWARQTEEANVTLVNELATILGEAGYTRLLSSLRAEPIVQTAEQAVTEALQPK